MSDYQKQLANAEARFKKLADGRPEVYRAWDDTTFHKNPAAYHDAHAKLRAYDIAKEKVWDEVAELRKLIAKEKLKKFDRVQDIFDAGYALPNYDIETKPGAWRNAIFIAQTLSWIYKNYVYNTDRFVTVEKILFKGEMIYVLPHKEGK
jgi:hypothetical protein